MEETLKLILTKLTSLEEGQKALLAGQKTLETRQASLEEHQISLEKRQIALEERQTSLEDGQESLIKGQTEIRLELDRRITESENMILKELDKVQEQFDTRLASVEKNLEEIQQYYRNNRLENDNTTLLLKLHDDIQKRVTELERKTA